MVQYITIAPPPGSFQAMAEAAPVEISNEERIAIAVEKSKAAARAREERVKKFLELEEARNTAVDDLSHREPPQLPQSPDTSSTCTTMTAPSPFKAFAYPLFVMSVSSALNSLLYVASKTSPLSTQNFVAAAAADALGPPLLQAFGLPRFDAEAAMPADAANVFELYMILDTVIRCAPLSTEGLLDAYMLINSAVRAGYKLPPENLRQSVIAALGTAYEREAVARGQLREPVDVFAARCFPSLNLISLAATEYLLSQKLGFDLSFITNKLNRRSRLDELAMAAVHYERVTSSRQPSSTNILFVTCSDMLCMHER
eukprot:6202781-Pleurochrysis_carterae.AAC.2